MDWFNLRENRNRKPSIFPLNMGLSCKFSLKQIPLNCCLAKQKLICGRCGRLLRLPSVDAAIQVRPAQITHSNRQQHVAANSEGNMPFQAMPSDSKRFLQEHLDARSAAQSAVATWAGLVGDSPSWMAATWAPLHVLAQRLATCSPCLSGVRDSQSHSPCILIILAATSTWKFWA